jgi:hypothetical protein
VAAKSDNDRFKFRFFGHLAFQGQCELFFNVPLLNQNPLFCQAKNEISEKNSEISDTPIMKHDCTD